MADIEFSHEDFKLVRADPRFGGFEEVKLKDGSTHTRFFRKSVTPGDADGLANVAELESYVMKDGSFGIVHPVYTHEGKKWVLLSVPDEHYELTGLAA